MNATTTMTVLSIKKIIDNNKKVIDNFNEEISKFMQMFGEMEEKSAEFIMANHMVINSKVLAGKKECIKNMETIILMIVRLFADKSKELSTADKCYLYCQMRSHKGAIKVCIEQKADLEEFHEMLEEVVRQLNAEEAEAKEKSEAK